MPVKPEPADRNQILVIGSRTIIGSLADVPVEQTYDADRVASYGVSTVGEILDAVKRENGDSDPAILINGQPAPNGTEISDYPVEAVTRIETLPPGSASRIGGAPAQRAYNVVLKPSVKTLTITASREVATEGHWSQDKGEAIVTLIRNQDRINLALRLTDSDPLFEAQRGVLSSTSGTPFSPLGNILPSSALAGEIDPALSAAAGFPVTVVALPAGNATPSLGDLVAGANRVNPGLQGAYRTLRGANRPVEASLSANKTLAPWLSLSVVGRLNDSRSTSYSGLPAAVFAIPAANGFTPFTVPVLLALSDSGRPLASRTHATTGSFAGTLNANWGEWRATVVARYDSRERTTDSDRAGSLPSGLRTVDPATNPFAGTLAALIPVLVRTTHSQTRTSQFSADVDGPLFRVPAGSVRGRAGVGVAWLDFASSSTTAASQSLHRREVTLKGGITIPLTSDSFLPGLGDTDLSVDFGRLDLGRYGRIDRRSVALGWAPLPWLRLNASDVRDGFANAPELLAAPAVIIDNVPFFDPVTGATPDVTLITGGTPDFRNQTQRTRTLSLDLSPMRKINLQIGADYSVIDSANQAGALPVPSAAVVAAFPDRFVRDAAGQLVLVDTRTVNFTNQHNRQLRLSTSFGIPLTPQPVQPRRIAGQPVPHVLPRLMLQFDASHIWILESRTVIRPGLPEVDLLDGGAVGIGGGQQRHFTTFGGALYRGGTGIRFSAQWRGSSQLRVGTVAAPDLLRFAPLFRMDVKAYTDIGELFPGSSLTHGSRLTLTVTNIGNSRQSVVNALGITPLGYQPGYRDPIGRTVMLELRKVF